MSAPRWRAVPDGQDADPGTLWDYVIAQSWVAAVPRSTDDAVLAALLELRGAAASTLERVLAVIPLQGEHAVEDFAIAELAADIDGTAGDGTEGTVSVIVRGRAAVDVFGASPQRLTSRGIRPWLLADFREVGALSFSVANARPITASELPPRGVTASVDGDGQWAEQGGAQQGSALRGRRLDLVLGVPGAAEEEPAGPDGAAVHRMRIAGEIFVLDVDSYIGRRPHARTPAQHTARLITVNSPAQEVSASHILVGQRGEEVQVTDLRSTNGTLVELPDGAQLHLQPGVATAIAPGSRILLGDGVVVELLPLAADGAPRWR